MKKSTVKNDWAKSIKILILHYTGGTNMAKVLALEPFFYKFQTRLNEVANANREFKSKLQKIPIPFKNKLDDKTGYYFQYTFIGNKQFLKDLFVKLNKFGLKQK